MDTDIITDLEVPACLEAVLLEAVPSEAADGEAGAARRARKAPGIEPPNRIVRIAQIAVVGLHVRNRISDLIVVV